MRNTAPVALVTGLIDETVAILWGGDRIWILRVTVFLSTVLIWWPAARLPAASESNEAQIVAHFRAGQQATQLGQFERAVEEYKKVLNLDPNLLEARVNLGLAYHSLGQYSLAVSELSRALRQRPQLLGPHIILGIDYLKLGFPEKAIPPLQRALSIESSNREARRALAACYLARGDYREAAKQFRTIFSLETDKAQAWYELGQNYLDLAKRLGSQMARSYQSSAWADHLAGDLFAERQLWTDAVIKYQQALERESTQPGLNASLGSVSLHLGKLEGAEGAFRAELSRDPYNEDALLGLAEIQLAKGDAEAAVESISKIWVSFPFSLGQHLDFPSIRLDPETASKLATDLKKGSATPARHFILTGLYRAAGKDERAREEWAGFEQLLKEWEGKPVNPEERGAARQLCEAHRYAACVRLLQLQKALDTTGDLLLGRALLALGRYERAADTFAAGLISDKGNVEAVYWLIRTYMKLADACFNQLMERFPDSWRVHQIRGDTQKLRTAYKQAIKEYQIATRLRPEEPEIHEKLGEAYLLDKSWEQAEAELKKVLQLDRTRVRSLYLLSRVYLGKHEEQKSIPYFETALRYDPGLLEAHAGLGQAYVRIGDAARAVPELEVAAPVDYYGDLHHLLYLAYSKLGQRELAQKALARSQELRRSSAAAHQARVAEAVEVLQK